MAFLLIFEIQIVIKFSIFFSLVLNFYCLDKSLLMIAAEKGSIELVSKLLEFDAHLELKDNWGKSALFYAIDAKNNNYQLVSFFLDKGADPNARCKNGTTPLFRAVEISDFHIVDLLLKRKCNVFIKQESTGNFSANIEGFN